MRLGVGIIGAGRMGARRARVAAAAGDRIVGVADPDADRAVSLAAGYGAQAFPDAESLAAGAAVDAVVVATPHRWLAPAALAAIEAGADALVEKPLAVSVAEAQALVAAAGHGGRILATGFTLRRHPAIRRIAELVRAGAIGRPLHLRCTYGHGGRAGYEYEWRARPEEGGGELLDQGVHMVDLARWLLGEIAEVHAVLAQSFWPVPVEDSAFLLLRAAAGPVASLHASWTEWRNRFALDLVGDEGLLAARGLGGSYGPERLRLVQRPAAGGGRGFGPPVEQEFVFTGDDAEPWKAEWEAFRRAVATRQTPEADGRAGLAALEVVEAARRAHCGRRAATIAQPAGAAAPVGAGAGKGG